MTSLILALATGMTLSFGLIFSGIWLAGRLHGGYSRATAEELSNFVSAVDMRIARLAKLEKTVDPAKFGALMSRVSKIEAALQENPPEDLQENQLINMLLQQQLANLTGNGNAIGSDIRGGEGNRGGDRNWQEGNQRNPRIPGVFVPEQDSDAQV